MNFAMGYDFIEEERGACLECGEIIRYGRSDRKFCCEKCKNKFNNRKTRNVRSMKLRIWNSLEKNHSILDNLLKMGIDTIHLPDLSALGFNIDYSTSYHKVGSRKEFRCFDILYYMSDSRIFGIRRVAAFISELGKIGQDSVTLHKNSV